jgi:hypothetical protein
MANFGKVKRLNENQLYWILKYRTSESGRKLLSHGRRHSPESEESLVATNTRNPGTKYEEETRNWIYFLQSVLNDYGGTGGAGYTIYFEEGAFITKSAFGGDSIVTEGPVDLGLALGYASNKEILEMWEKIYGTKAKGKK